MVSRRDVLKGMAAFAGAAALPLDAVAGKRIPPLDPAWLFGRAGDIPPGDKLEVSLPSVRFNGRSFRFVDFNRDGKYEFLAEENVGSREFGLFPQFNYFNLVNHNLEDRVNPLVSIIHLRQRGIGVLIDALYEARKLGIAAQMPTVRIGDVELYRAKYYDITPMYPLEKRNSPNITILRPFTLRETVERLVKARNTAPYDSSLMLTHSLYTVSGVVAHGRKYTFVDVSQNLVILTGRLSMALIKNPGSDGLYTLGHHRFAIGDQSFPYTDLEILHIYTPDALAVGSSPAFRLGIDEDPLTLNEFLAHEDWGQMLGNDDESQKLKREYWKIVSDKVKEQGGSYERVLPLHAVHADLVPKGTTSLLAVMLGPATSAEDSGLYFSPPSVKGGHFLIPYSAKIQEIQKRLL